MEALTDREIFLHLWQKKNLETEGCSTTVKADTIRFNLGQLSYSRNFSDISDDTVAGKARELLQHYGQLMDKPEKDGGLNNYADPILTLIGNSRNESKSWKCGLSSTDIGKYLKSYPGVPRIPSSEYKELAGLLNRTLDQREAPLRPEGSCDARATPRAQGQQEQKEQTRANSTSGFTNNYFDVLTTGCNRDQEALRASNTQATEQLGPHTLKSNYSATTAIRGRGARENAYPWNRGNLTGRGRNVGVYGGTVDAAPSNASQNPFDITISSGTPRLYEQGSGYGLPSSRPWGGGENFPETHQRGGPGTRWRGRERGKGNYPYKKKNEEIYSDEAGHNEPDSRSTCFKTASHQLLLEQQKKYGRGGMAGAPSGTGKRSLGVRRTVSNKFVPPVRREDEESYRSGGGGGAGGVEDSPYAELLTDERLANIDPKMVELIMNEIMESGPNVSWDDIAGLELAKSTIQEIVVWPMLRPDIFTGLRGPPKGLLLFGPPGTGKTMIGKCIACQSGSTFFSISASSLTSKWVGEGEKMVRAMFAVARCHQPAVIFIDEIDSLLTQRSDTEHESSRRIKTEFLVQLDGATTGSEERLLVVGATNRPQELDEAARRRLVKKLYIPLPGEKARQQIIEKLMANQSHTLVPEEVVQICESTDGYSGADMANLCREAALGPIRSISVIDIQHISVDQVRPITSEDFMKALSSIKASVSDKDLNMYEDWNKKFGISSR